MITTRDRVIGFFLRSPDEEMTRLDMHARWGGGLGTIWDVLQTMRADGLLEARPVSSKKNELVYRPTPLLLSLGDGTK